MGLPLTGHLVWAVQHLARSPPRALATLSSAFSTAPLQFGQQKPTFTPSIVVDCSGFHALPLIGQATCFNWPVPSICRAALAANFFSSALKAFGQLSQQNSTLPPA